MAEGQGAPLKPRPEGPPSSSSGAPLGPLGDPTGSFVYFDEDSAKKLEFCPSRGTRHTEGPPGGLPGASWGLFMASWGRADG